MVLKNGYLCYPGTLVAVVMGVLSFPCSADFRGFFAPRERFDPDSCPFQNQNATHGQRTHGWQLLCARPPSGSGRHLPSGFLSLLNSTLRAQLVLVDGYLRDPG